MADSSYNEFIPVNQVLNLKPRLGPIPGDQVVPWVSILLVAYIVCQGLLGLPWTTTILISGWGIGTWWVLTGDAAWKFLSKFYGTPHWVIGHLMYQSPLEEQQLPPPKPSKVSRSKKLKRIRD